MPTQLPRLENCLNCGASVSGNFCSHCGQENEDQTVALRLLFSDICTEILSFDSKLLRTLTPLLVRPGFLTREYNAGKRMRYLSPLKMYLVASAVFFLLVSFYTPHIGPIKTSVSPAIDKDAAQGLEQARAALRNVPAGAPGMQELKRVPGLNLAQGDDHSAHPAQAKPHANSHSERTAAPGASDPTALAGTQIGHALYGAASSSRPDSAQSGVSSHEKDFDSGVNTGESAALNALHFNNGQSGSKIARWVQPRAEKLKSNPRALITGALDMAPKVMFVLLPLFALLLKAVYLRRKRLYVEHLIFALHIHACFFILLAITLVLRQSWFSTAVTCYMPLYVLIAMKKVYNQSWVKTFAKFCILSFNYLLLLCAGIGAAVGLAFVTMQ